MSDTNTLTPTTEYNEGERAWINFFRTMQELAERVRRHEADKQRQSSPEVTHKQAA